MNIRNICFPALALLAVLLLTGPVLAQGAAAAPPGDFWGRAARWAVSPWATVALLSVGCLLLFLDLLTLHTWGVSGTLGVIAVGSVFAAHVAVGTGGWIGIVVFLLGLLLLLIETHVVPGHGMAGFAGMTLLFLGMFWTLDGTQNAVFALSVSTILTVLGIVGFFAYLPRSPVWKKLGQEMQQRASLGYVTSDSQMHFLGRVGTAATVLRPSGLAEFDGVRLDVVTEGDFLPPGTPVEVIRVEGGRVVVENAAPANKSEG